MNLGSGNVSNCENAIPMVKEFDNIIKCKKKKKKILKLKKRLKECYNQCFFLI